jgi:hypothetical protein
LDAAFVMNEQELGPAPSSSQLPQHNLSYRGIISVKSCTI